MIYVNFTQILPNIPRYATRRTWATPRTYATLRSKMSYAHVGGATLHRAYGPTQSFALWERSDLILRSLRSFLSEELRSSPGATLLCGALPRSPNRGYAPVPHRATPGNLNGG